MTPQADLRPGARAIDRDDDEPGVAVVVNTPDVPACEWDVGDRTVADYPGNEGYDDEAPVVVVVFEEAIEEHGIDVDGSAMKLAELAAEGVPFYAFPAPRLEPVDAGPVPEPPDELLAIADRLRAGGMEVELDADAEAVRATKLGEEYIVSRDGTVEGGVLEGRVRAAVKEVLAG